MIIFASEHIDVHRRFQAHRQRDKEMGDVFGGQVPQHLTFDTELDLGPGSTREIDDRPRQRLVQRRISPTETCDSCPFPEGAIEGTTESKGTVFSSVMIVFFKSVSAVVGTNVSQNAKFSNPSVGEAGTLVDRCSGEAPAGCYMIR